MSSSKVSRFMKVVKGTRKISAKELVIIALAELLGTAMLLFLGCMGGIGGFSGTPPHLQITLNFGLAVLIVITCFGHISHAHVNPAITVGAVVLGKKTILEALVYFVAQLFGSILGFGLLKVVTPAQYLMAIPNTTSDGFCMTLPHHNLHFVQGLLIEGVATAILMLIACGLWDPRNSENTDSVAIKFGLAVTALATSVGPYTGCSMNPVRSLAPAIWSGNMSYQEIYWLGPIGGSLLASLAYKSVFSPKESDDEDSTIPESVALNRIDTQKAEMDYNLLRREEDGEDYFG